MSISSSITELGTKPVGSLLVKYATPAVIAMTASSLYNIIDAIFIGQGVGPLAIAGVSLSFPVMQLTAAFGAMVGVGASTLMSVKLGERDYETARRILGNVLVMNIVMGVLIGCAMLLALNPLLYFFGASDATVQYAREFMQVILWGNVVTHAYLGMNALLRSAGHPKSAMYATIIAVILNIILAPLFIYVFHWGLQGAASATVLSQTIVLLWQIKLFARPKEFIHFERKGFRLSSAVVWGCLAIGLSPFLMNLCACFVSVFINWSITHYGDDMQIGAFGITNRLAFLYIMIVMGLNQGMQPIAGFNYGARRYDRLVRSLKLTILGASIIMCIAFIMGVFFPVLCARAFTTDEDLIERSAHAIRIVFITFPIIGFQMVTTNFFQCIRQVKKSIFLSLSRQLLFLVPCLYFLPFRFGLDGIFYSMPASDVLATVTTAFFLLHSLRSFKAQSKISSITQNGEQNNTETPQS